MLKTVKTENGTVRGIAAADPRIISYKGIPFAAPPIGQLRWRAPQPCADWQGMRDCLEFAPISMQSVPGIDQDNIYTKEWNVDPQIPMSEDCLYLNVWTPAKQTTDCLPVYVWFFGGALQWGNCAEMEFDAERIARRGIVVVTVNYRLNVFGFLTHPALAEEDTSAGCNFGNLDQQFALQWTKRNIRAFGGDPDQITVGGQSAGGGSVITQLNCPDNRKCIQRAIIASGLFCAPYQKIYGISKEAAMQQSIEFFALLGVKSVAEARELPAEMIRDKNDQFNRFWGTVIDGKYQTGSYQEMIRQNRFLDVPLLLGWTNHEFPLPESSKYHGAVSATEVGSLSLCSLKEESHYSSPSYVYEFGTAIPGEDQPGAFHSSDLWFFFETLAKCSRPFVGKHYDLSRQMCNYWCNFIKTGDPNGVDSDGIEQEKWKSYQRKQPYVMKFYEKPALSRKE